MPCAATMVTCYHVSVVDMGSNIYIYITYKLNRSPPNQKWTIDKSRVMKGWVRLPNPTQPNLTSPK